MNSKNNTEGFEAIVFFDGVCNFCNSSINFIIRNDKKGYFHFAALQSETAARLIPEINLEVPESVVLKEGLKIYTKSTAALRIAKRMDGLWPVFYLFIIIPKFLRDPLYDIIGRNRYRWFGKKESCMIPGPDIRSRFI